MPVSFLFLVIASKVGEPFMGRSIGGSPFGEVREHEDLIDYISGGTLLVVGCLTGWWLTKNRWTRGFGFGLIVCAMIVGALKFFQN